MDVNRIRHAIEDKLQTRTQQTLWKLVELEARKDSTIVFRIMDGVQVLDELWKDVIEPTCVGLRVHPLRRSKFHTVAELDDVLGSISWVWRKWIPVGLLTLLVGEPGTGKSLVALDWVKKVTTPIAFIGDPLPPAPSLAVWVEAEASQQLLNTRTKSMGVPRDRVLLPGFDNDLLGQPDLTNATHRERLVNIISATKPLLAVIDSIGGSQSRGENRIEEVRPTLDFLARVSRDHYIAILALHHLRKRGANESMEVVLDRVRGSTGFAAFARAVIALESRGDNSLRLSMLKTNVSSRPNPLTVRIKIEQEEPRLVEYEPYQPPAPKRTKLQKCSEWLISHLTDHGRTAVQEILQDAALQGYTKLNIYNARELIDELIVSEQVGRTAFWSPVSTEYQNNLVEQLNGEG